MDYGGFCSCKRLNWYFIPRICSQLETLLLYFVGFFLCPFTHISPSRVFPSASFSARTEERVRRGHPGSSGASRHQTQEALHPPIDEEEEEEEDREELILSGGVETC